METGIIRDPDSKGAIEALVRLVSRRLSWARRHYDRGRSGLPMA